MNLVAYALLWLSFGYMHSVLTLPAVKTRLTPWLGRGYRVSYNVFALFHFLVVFLIGHSLFQHDHFPPFSFSALDFLFDLCRVAGVVVILLALRQYDIGRFTGLTQLISGSQLASEVVEPLNITGLNKWVRHPLYTGLFMFVWGGATSPFGLTTAVFASVYLVIGTYYEEKKLVVDYGEAYLEYKASVSAYFPRRFFSVMRS